MNPFVVVDTNVWISGLFWHGVPKEVIDRFEEQKITPCFSAETFVEWEEKIPLAASLFNNLPVYVRYRRLIIKRAMFVRPQEHVTVCRDPKDNQFLDVAVASNAQFLVTGDKDLLSLKKFRTTRILTPRRFLEEVSF